MVQMALAPVWAEATYGTDEALRVPGPVGRRQVVLLHWVPTARALGGEEPVKVIAAVRLALALHVPCNSSRL